MYQSDGRGIGSSVTQVCVFSLRQSKRRDWEDLTSRSEVVRDHHRVFNTGDHFNLTAAAFTDLNVDIEHVLKALHPGHDQRLPRLCSTLGTTLVEGAAAAAVFWAVCHQYVQKEQAYAARASFDGNAFLLVWSVLPSLVPKPSPETSLPRLHLATNWAKLTDNNSNSFWTALTEWQSTCNMYWRKDCRSICPIWMRMNTTRPGSELVPEQFNWPLSAISQRILSYRLTPVSDRRHSRLRRLIK